MAKKDDRNRFLALVAEAKERGIQLPKEVINDVLDKKTGYHFPKDEFGYYFRRDGTRFKPNPKQESFCTSSARYCAMVAGRGAGKSCSAAQKAIKKLEQGFPGAVMNPDFENFKMSTWPEFREWIPESMVIPRHRYMLEPGWMPTRPFRINFNNGAWAICKGLKNPDSARGPNINWLWFDEPGRGDMEGLDWQIANAAVRIGDMPQAWATGTPNGKEHWLYSFFIEQNIPEEAFVEFEKANQSAGIERDLLSIVFTSIEDNKHNLDPAYYASMLAAYPEGWLRRQELYGEFVDKGGILGSAAWFDGKVIPIAPVDVIGRIRFWDLAASEKKIVRGRKISDPDETVGTLMSWDKEGNFYIEDQTSGFWTWGEIKVNITQSALFDGPMVPIVVEQEPGSGGINQVAALAEFIREQLPGFPTIKGSRPEGDKIQRANIWFAEAANGKFFMVRDGNRSQWNRPFLNQLGSFPIGRHDDRIDSVSGARMNLAPIITWRRIDFLKL